MVCFLTALEAHVRSCVVLGLAATLLCCSCRLAGPRGEVLLLPNPGFEQTGPASVDAYTKAGCVPPSAPSCLGMPAGWTAYQWGSPREARFSVSVEGGAGHTGSAALRAENLDASARGGVYAHVRLEPGTYELSAWARVPPGQNARVAMYLASA